MSTITGTIIHNVAVGTSGAYASPLTIAPTGYVDVSAGFSAVYELAAGLTVINQGRITTTVSAGIGVAMGLGGLVSNSGTIQADAGIEFGAGASDTVMNTGKITANTFGVFLTNGGSVNNAAGLIQGQVGVELTSTGTVTNSATIIGRGKSGGGGYYSYYYSGIAIQLFSGGRVDNNGGLVEGNYGILINNGIGTVTNSGTVNATSKYYYYPADAITLRKGGSVVNTGFIDGTTGVNITGAAGFVTNGQSGSSSGIITAYQYGIFLSSGAVTNFGQIVSTGTNSIALDIEGAGTVLNFGTVRHNAKNGTGAAIFLGSGGLVENYGLASGAGPQNVPGRHSIGVIIIHGPAKSGTVQNFGTVTTTTMGENGIDLDTGGKLFNGTTIGSAALITASAQGVYIGGTAGMLTPGGLGFVYNYGTILNSSTASQAVRLVSGGLVTNHGLIASQRTGISFANTAGTVNNFGTVSSTAPTSFTAGAGVYLQSGGQITNQSSGLIRAYKTAVALTGTTAAAATITNAGTISGSAGISIGIHNTGKNTISNSGVITGTSGAGVYLGAGGGVVNGQSGSAAGMILGYQSGINTGTAGAATVVNFGTIASTGTSGIGVKLQDSPQFVENGANGTVQGLISGGSAGVLFNGPTGTLLNYGTVVATSAAGAGAEFAGGGIQAIFGASTVLNYGTVLGTGTSSVGISLQGSPEFVENGASGTTDALISGGYVGVLFSGPTGTLVNYGTVIATNPAGTGAEFAGGGTIMNAGTIIDGGVAISFGGTSNNRLILEPGSAIIGPVQGSTAPGATNTIELAAGTGGTGTISGLGTSFVNFGTVTIDPGAAWVFAGESTLAAGTSLVVAAGSSLVVNGDTLTVAGSLNNNGSIVLRSSPAELALESGATGAGAIVFTASGETLAIGGSGPVPNLGNAIEAFQIGDTIDVEGIIARRHSYSGGELQLFSGATVVAQLTVSTPYAHPVFKLTADGHGGTDVTLLHG